MSLSAIESGLYQSGRTMIEGKVVDRITARCSTCPQVITRGATERMPLQAMDSWLWKSGWRIHKNKPFEKRYTCPRCFKEHRTTRETLTLQDLGVALQKQVERKFLCSPAAIEVPPVAPAIASVAPATVPLLTTTLRLSVTARVVDRYLTYQLRADADLVAKLPGDCRVLWLITADKRLVLRLGDAGAKFNAISGKYHMMRPSRHQQAHAPKEKVSTVLLPATFDGKEIMTVDPLPRNLWPSAMDSAETTVITKPVKQVPVVNISSITKKETVVEEKQPNTVQDIIDLIKMINDALDADSAILIRVEGNRLKARRQIIVEEDI